LIGMGAIVLDGAVIEDGAIVAAGAVVPPGAVVSKAELWAGNPAKFVKKLDDDAADAVKKSAEAYLTLQLEHANEFTTSGTAHRDL